MDMKADSNFTKKLSGAWAGISQNWLRYAALIVTGALTGLAGFTLTGNAFYTGALVLLAEGASLFWTARASDNGNGTQETISYIGGAVAWIAIILTDLASATILAKMANIEIFTAFQSVPGWAQNVVTYVLPILAVTHGVLGTAHHYFSEDARLTRDVSATRREAERQIKQARANAEVNIARAEANKYRELAESNAERIGHERGATLWTDTYKSNDNGNDKVTTKNSPNLESNDNAEVGQSVPFTGNGRKSSNSRTRGGKR